MKQTLLPLLVAALSACTSAPLIESQCGGDQGRNLDARIELTKVHLPPMPQEPVFYFASGHYAIVIPPERLSDLLNLWVKNGTATSNEMLLRAVQADIPLTGDTDLRKYSIRQTRFDFFLPHIAAALLHNGHASVIDLWQMDEDKELSEVIVANVFKSLSEHRYFCEPAGETILFVTDMIAQQNSPNSRVQPTLAQARAVDADRWAA